jgi:hypothetical protein
VGALDDEQIISCADVVAGKAIVLKPYARVGLPIVLRGGGRSTILSWGLQRGRWCRKPADLRVRCRAPASILTDVVAAPVPPAVLLSRLAFAVRPALSHHLPTRRGCTSGLMVGVNPAAGGRAYALRAVRLPCWARGPAVNRAFFVWGLRLAALECRTFCLLLGGHIQERLEMLTELLLL